MFETDLWTKLRKPISGSSPYRLNDRDHKLPNKRTTGSGIVVRSTRVGQTQKGDPRDGRVARLGSDEK